MQRTQSIDSEHRLNGNGNSEGLPLPGDYGVTSSSRGSKKAKIVDNEEDGLLAAFNRVGDNIAKALEKSSAAPPLPWPPTMNYQKICLTCLLAFLVLKPLISVYFQYLVKNPDLAKAF
jgi:hypothetical protein